MKRKIKQLMGILLTLALMLGLLPGMSVTAYARFEPAGLEHFIPHLDNGGNLGETLI